MSGLRLSPEHAAWAQAAADLVNSAPRATDPPEKLAGVAELEALLAACPEPAPVVDEQDLAAMRDLRPPLRAAFEAETLDAFAAAVNPLLERDDGGRRMLRHADGTWRLAPAAPSAVSAWFGARGAQALAELVIGYGIDRLHVCAADDCLRAVVDISRNGTRRFCSRTCSSRTNVRRHRLAHADHE